MNALSPEHHARLSEAVRRHGLEGHLAAIAALGRPASRAVSEGPDDYASPGTTRFGGDPDLPSKMRWPRARSGPLPGAAVFIAQIDLASLPVAPPGLPRDGLLSLFVQGTESAAMPVRVHAFYFVVGTELARRTSPRELCDEYLVALRPVRVRWEPTVSLADWTKSGLLDALGSGLARFFDLLVELAGGLGQVAGHARDHGEGDLRLAAVLAREGHPRAESVAMFESRAQLDAFLPSASEYRRRQLTGLALEADWWFDNRARVLGEVERWQCVLRLASNREMGLQINDADPLFFLAHEGDLGAGRFERMVGRVLQG